jgi:hypothetical protein
VLQGWSKSTFNGRVIGVAFVLAMGVAAGWGVKMLVR